MSDSFYCFIFCSLARSKYLSLFSLSFNFILWSAETSAIQQVIFFFFFFFFFDDYGLLAESKRFVCISKSQRTLYVFFFQNGFSVMHIIILFQANSSHQFLFSFLHFHSPKPRKIHLMMSRFLRA